MTSKTRTRKAYPVTTAKPELRPVLVDMRGLSELTSISVDHIKKIRSEGGHTLFNDKARRINPNGKLYWLLTDVEKWANELPIDSTYSA